MEAVQITFAAALLIGFSYGAGPCNIACLPYLGPIFLSRESERLGRWGTILPFSAGRIFSYALLGTAAGLIGAQITDTLKGGSASIILGGVTIAVGLWLLYRSRSARSHCCRTPAAEHSVEVAIPTTTPEKSNRRFAFGLFGMGFSMALNPCLPLGTIAVAAAATADPIKGMWLGLGFGLGAVVFPGLLFGWLLSRFGDEIRHHLANWQHHLERITALLLMLLGSATLMGWISP